MYLVANRCGRAIACWSIAACAVALGCDEEPQGYCEAKIECEGGAQADIDDCLARMAAEEETAAACGCAEQYADWARCLLEQGSCQTSGWVLVEGDGGEATWEPIADGAGAWVTDGACDVLGHSLFDCETAAGLDPDNGGECGG